MTVATFFKDNRVQSALAGNRPAQASSIMQDFFAQFGYADCSTTELLALADLAVRCADNDVARTALNRAIDVTRQNGGKLHTAYYKLGRVDLAAGNFAAAVQSFRLGTEADPDFAYNWMGAARALHALGDTDEACHYAERFVAFSVRPHAASELAVLADLADHLFDAGDRKRSRPLFELLAKFGATKPRDVVRLAEAHIAGGDFATARQLLMAEEKRGKLDPWGRRALATCHSHAGDHAAAIAVAEAVALESPANAGFVATYIDVLGRAGDAAHIEAALARNAAILPREGAAELAARMKLSRGDIAGAAADLAGCAIAPHSRLYYLCFETSYAALAAGLFNEAQALGDRLGGIAPHDMFVGLLRVDICFRQQMWERAAEILAALPRAHDDDPHLVLKRFECACFVGDIPRAIELCARLDGMELPGKQFMLPIFRFLAERNEWPALIDRALPWLDAQLNYAQIGYVIFRAAKHTGRQAEVIAAVEAIDGWADRPDLVKLRANLAYDRAESLFDLERLARDPTVAADPTLQHKIDIKRGVLARALAHGKRRAVFLCSDSNYLTATFVALHGLAAVIDRNGVDLFIVVDDEAADIARACALKFTEHGYSLTIVAASEVVVEAEKLYAGYGLFTSGHVLARAAYYRIYFAKHLQLLGTYDRAVYVDSDVLLRGPLDPLFVADLAGQPMAARLETMRPEVRRAIDLHGIGDGRYFNSGVLLFDLKNDRLAAGLDGAVAAIMDDDTILLFHDQCALNLGFRAGFADLDMNWNFPVNEGTRVADIPATASILHFLDRPKPWSAAYGGEAATLWYDRWRDTAAFIGEDLAVELFSRIND